MKTRCNLTVVLLGAMFAFLFAASARAGAGDAYASAVHVATDGDDSAAGTAAEPMQTIAAAVAKAAQTPGTAVVVHPGTHSLASKLTLSGGMTLVADEGPQKTTLTCASGGMDLLEVKDADTVLSGFSITMPSLGGSRKCLTVGTGAVVTNCVVRDLKTSAEAVSEPVLVSGGTMVDCVITNFIMENKWNSKMGVKISSGLVDRCVIVDNVAKYKDSGSEGAVRISGGTLRNSLVARNRSTGNGTGVTLSGSGCVENCTIVGNSCYSGADATATGLYQTGGTVVNTIIYGNTSLKGDPANVTKSGGTLTCSCMTPLKTGTGNIDGVPAFADAASGDYRLVYCAATDAGTPLSWQEGATDLSGARARVLGNAVDMGCYESEPPALGCYFTLNALSGFAPLAMTATATVAGDTAGLVYKWYVNGGATPDFSGADCASVSWNYTAGTKSVRLVVENGAGLAATNEISGISVSPKVAYVDCTNTSGSAYPYDGDGNACTNIEEVLAKCLTGVEVRVKPGTYTLNNTVYLTGGTKLVATGGPLVTTLTCPDKTMGLLDTKDEGTVLSGFSLTMPSVYGYQKCLSVGTGAVVTNCIVRDLKTNSEVVEEAVVVSGGTMVDCMVTNFVCQNKWKARTGVKMSSGLIDRCVIVDNVAKYSGDIQGAVRISGGTLRNSLVARNRTTGSGTGVTLSGGTVENCTIVGNSCYSGTDATATGLYQTGGTVVNAIIWGNTALDGSVANVKKTSGSLTYSCMTPKVDATGNVDGVPKFADAASGDYRLEYCAAADAGTPLSWHEGATDLSLVRARVLGDAVDMGCYESEPVSFACSFELNALSGFAPLAMTATATVVGDATGVVYRWYVNGGAQPDFEGTDCASVSWNYSAGLKTVRLEVENASHQTATSTISGISVSPKVAYVDCTNTSGSARPYDGEGNAGTNLEEVLAACLPGVEVRVKPGTYTLGAVVNLAGGTKLVATGGPLVTTLTCPDKAMDLLDVRDAGTVLSGFSLTMPKIYMLNCCLTVGTGGVVTNCIVRDLGADHDNMKTITVSGGTMVDCLVTNIVIAPKFTYLSRTGVKLSSGLVDRCVIVDNSTGDQEGAVQVSGGVLRNSLVTRNRSPKNGTGVTVSGSGRVENCTVVSNSCNSGTDATAKGLHQTGGTVVNTVVWGNTALDGSVANVSKTGGSLTYSCMTPLADGTGNTEADPLFRDAANGNYTLMSASPCLRTGSAAGYTGGSADCDLAGKPRFYGTRIDMGAYGRPKGGLSLIIR